MPGLDYTVVSPLVFSQLSPKIAPITSGTFLSVAVIPSKPRRLTVQRDVGKFSAANISKTAAAIIFLSAADSVGLNERH